MEELKVREADDSIEPSMKPGRVKRWVRVDWFTLLFEFPRCELSSVITWSHSTVRRGLFWGASFLLSGFTQALRLFQSFRTFPYPLEPDRDSKQAGFSFPLGPHLRDYWSAVPRSGDLADGRPPTGTVAEHRPATH